MRWAAHLSWPIAILGWPVSKLSAEIANRVVQGGRDVCAALGFPLAGGHSIDAPEPIFGLAVTGTAHPAHLKRNDAAQDGDGLILTKPLGIGILTTAEKQNKLEAAHVGLAAEVMCQPNDVGGALATMEDVHALTDVTGFGLAGHLLEMCEGAGLSATLDLSHLPQLPGLSDYIEAGCVPGWLSPELRRLWATPACHERRHACTAVRSANQRRPAHCRRAPRDPCGAINSAGPRPASSGDRCTTGERPLRSPLFNLSQHDRN